MKRINHHVMNFLFKVLNPVTMNIFYFRKRGTIYLDTGFPEITMKNPTNLVQLVITSKIEQRAI